MRSALYNIGHNKAYAAFCIFGTALTFVFIIILLQLAHTVTSNDAPLRNADRTIELLEFVDEQGEYVSSVELPIVRQLQNAVKGYEAIAISHAEPVILEVGNHFQPVKVNFVNHDYWKVRDLDFAEGKPFDKEESLPVAVIKESNARQYFGNESALGKKIVFQSTEYTIIGVVRDFSNIMEEGGYHVWVSYKYNKNIPSGDPCYTTSILFPKGTPTEQMKQAVKSAVDYTFKIQDIEVDYKPETLREKALKAYQSGLSRYNLLLILAILLIIPAVNIITLSIANANMRTEEVAIRRAIGMTRAGSFIFLLGESLLLVLFGMFLGLGLAYPASNLVGTAMLGTVLSETNSLIPKIDYGIIFLQVFPLAILFALLSGGIPAFVFSRLNIAASLKGGSEKPEESSRWHRIKGFLWIYIEQSLVFIVLMLCMVSVIRKVQEYNTPGMLDSREVVNFGYMFDTKDWGDRRTQRVVHAEMEKIVENLKKSDAVIAITESYNMLPYLRPDEYNFSDSVEVDGKKIYTMIKGSDMEAFEVLHPVIEEGGWLPELTTNNEGGVPIVITRQFADSARWYDAIGKQINMWGGTFKVVGTIEGVKNSVFANSYPTIILPMEIVNGRPMMYVEYAARIKPGHKDQFTNDYVKAFRKTVSSPNVDLYLHDLGTWKQESMLETTAPLIAQSIPTVFFLVFGFIGTFGLFWLYSRKRVGEFALRRAVGATKVRLVRMVIIESVVLSLLAAVPGLLLAIFIYSWSWTVLLGVGSTLVIMLLFSLFSAWYPAYKVSQVSPAEALHNE